MSIYSSYINPITLSESLKHPIFVDFGEVELGRSKTIDLLFKNDDLLSWNSTIPPLDYLVDHETFFSVPSQSSSTFSLHFTPDSLSRLSLSLAIYSHVPNIVLSISGQGSRYLPTLTLFAKAVLVRRRLKQAICVLSSVLNMRSIRNKFLRDRTSLIRFSAHCKRFLAQKSLEKVKKAVRLIEQAFITFKSRQRLRAERRLANLIFTLHIGKICREHFNNLRNSTKVLAPVVRGFLARSDYKKQRTAVLELQKFAKASIQRKRFIKQRSASTVINSHIRGFLSRSRFRNTRNLLLKMIVRSKSVVERSKFLEKRQAGTTLTRIIRGFLTRRRTQQLKNQIISIQSRTRSQLCRHSFIKSKQAALAITSVAKSFLTRRKFVIIRDFQRNVNKERQLLTLLARTALSRQRFLYQKAACDLLTLSYKTHKQRRKFTSDLLSLRSFATRCKTKLVREDFVKKRFASIVISKFMLRFITQRRYQNTLQNIIRYQQLARISNQRQLFKYQVRSLSLYSALAKSSLQRRRFMVVRSLFEKVVSHCRSKLVRSEFLKRRRSVVVLQSIVRTCQARRMFKERQLAVHCLCKYAKMVILRRNFVENQQALTTFTMCCHTFLARKNFLSRLTAYNYLNFWSHIALDRIHFLKHRSAALKIQSFIRNFLARKAAIQHQELLLNLVTWSKKSLEGKRQRLAEKRTEELRCFLFAAKVKVMIFQRSHVIQQRKKVALEFRKLLSKIFLRVPCKIDVYIRLGDLCCQYPSLLRHLFTLNTCHRIAYAAIICSHLGVLSRSLPDNHRKMVILQLIRRIALISPVFALKLTYCEALPCLLYLLCANQYEISIRDEIFDVLSLFTDDARSARQWRTIEVVSFLRRLRSHYNRFNQMSQIDLEANQKLNVLLGQLSRHGVNLNV
ncbi:hypothetical protein RCL1_008768 [Eukaryota sp. TZLM3-RCL]